MNRKKQRIPSTEAFFGQPEDCFALVNKYGTYNVQPTADTGNPFPAIAQGLPRTLANDSTEKPKS